MNEQLVWKGRYIYKQAHTLTLAPPVRTQELDFLRHKGVFLLILFFLKDLCGYKNYRFPACPRRVITLLSKNLNPRLNYYASMLVY